MAGESMPYSNKPQSQLDSLSHIFPEAFAKLYPIEKINIEMYFRQWPCPAGSPLKTQSTDLVLNDLEHELPLGKDGERMLSS